MSDLDEKLKELADTKGERKATWCEYCEEWVEQPMMVCRAGDKMPVTDAKIFVNTKPVKTLLAALRKCLEQRNSWAIGHCTTKEELMDNQADRNEEDAELVAILNGRASGNKTEGV